MERSVYAALHLAGNLSKKELDDLVALDDIDRVLFSRPAFISKTKYERLVSDFKKTLNRLKELGDFVTLLDENYPEVLKSIDSAPPVLFFKGDISIFATIPSISIVGARKADTYGRNLARTLSKKLAEAGILVISGLAMGIDSEAHRGAIESGGKTAAVIGSGLDRPYPACNSTLFYQIAEKGCVISEFPPSTTPARQNFPRRNRIIAALPRAVMVIQASIDSGSLITARFAAEYGRDVFAVPGDINRRNSEGTNWLLKHGAKVITDVEDVLEEYPELDMNKTTSDVIGTEVRESRVIEMLEERGPTDFSSLLALTGLSRDELFVELTDLQLLGIIEESGGMWQKA